MSKSSELDVVVKKYLIDAIDLLDCDIDDSEMNVKEKIAEIENIFMLEVGGWNIPQVGRQKAVANWLQGLPTPLNIEFYNNEILKLAVKWGSIPESYTERQARNILANYWNLLAAKLCQLFDGYRVPNAR